MYHAPDSGCLDDAGVAHNDRRHKEGAKLIQWVVERAADECHTQGRTLHFDGRVNGCSRGGKEGLTLVGDAALNFDTVGIVFELC